MRDCATPTRYFNGWKWHFKHVPQEFMSSTRPISTRFVQILATQISDVVWVYPNKLRSPEVSYSQL